jgi:hypothetical protein
MNFLAFIMIFFWVPETKERTLEELDYIFAVPVPTFATYQLAQHSPGGSSDGCTLRGTRPVDRCISSTVV